MSSLAVALERGDFLSLDVVGIGAATWDQLWLVSEFSGSETVQQAQARTAMGGGPVATALCMLAHLGHRCALLDVCGEDATGSLIREELQRRGVRTEAIQIVPEARSAEAVVLVRAGDGARQIHYLPSDAGEPLWQPELEFLIRRARLLHLNGRHENVARRAVQVAQAAGVLISFDGGAGRYRDSLRDLVAASQIRIVSRDFARCYAGSEEWSRQQEALMDANVKVAVMTDGVRGSHVWQPGQAWRHQPAEKARTVDTTGCGDIYHGAFLHGWLQGWDAMRCASLASQLAAKNAEGLGGRHACGETRPESAC
jgi:sulfofructose kinase